MYDAIIIGGGIAGMTAAIYTKRRNLETLLITIDNGGQMAKIAEIGNWPGVKSITGSELTQKTMSQLQDFGVVMKYEQAISIEKVDSGFNVTTTTNKYLGKAVILAFGKVPKTMNIPGEETFLGRGVSYCVTCDGPFFKNKDVAVIGGGNAALDAAILMSGIGNKVYLIHRRDQFRAEEYLVKKAKSITNIEIILNDQIEKIDGENTVSSVTLKSGRNIELGGVFIEVGHVVNNSLVKDLVKCDDQGQIEVDATQQTSVPGIFAAGDMTNRPFQQLVIAAGEGATAGLSTYDYIQKNN